MQTKENPPRQFHQSKTLRIAVSALILGLCLYTVPSESWAGKTSDQYLHEAGFDFSQGNYRSATKKYRKALKINSTEPTAYLGLSVALKAEGHLDESLSILNNLVKLYPNLPAPYYNIGEIKEAQGDLEGAKQAYKRYISLLGGKLPPSPEMHIKFRKMGLI